MGSGTNNGVRPQCCSLTPLLGSDPVAVCLWLRTDWDEGIVPLTWVAKGSLRGRPLWTGLVHAWFAGAKAAEQATEPPYDELTPADNALLDEETIQAIVEQVWPEDIHSEA